MFVNRKVPVLLVLLLPVLFPVSIFSQALESAALTDNRRQSTLETLDKIMYEQYNLLTSDRSAESLRVDLIVKDQLILWERINEAQQYLTLYDVVDLMSDLADNYYVLRARMDELAFQPEELTNSANELKMKLSEYVEIEEATPTKMAIEKQDIPKVPQPPGLEFHGGYALDAISVAAGGLERGTGFAQIVGLNLSLDLGKTAGLKGTSMYINTIYRQSNGISKLTGDWQGLSNMDGPDAFYLVEAWVEQKLFSGYGSLRMGIYDLKSEFHGEKSVKMFVNKGMSIGREFVKSGKKGPSIAPVTSLGVRLEMHTAGNEYFMVGIYDGVPSDPKDQTRTVIRLSEEDGALVNAEAGYKLGKYANSKYDRYLKFALGYWMYTAPQEEILRTNDSGYAYKSVGSQGGYALIEGTVFKEKVKSREGLTLFGRAGMADKTYNDISFSWSAGMVYNGLIPGRSQDAIGLAISSIYSGADFQESVRINGYQYGTYESAIELTYNFVANKWITIQPDFQYVINPGLGSAADKTVTAGARFKVGF